MVPGGSRTALVGEHDGRLRIAVAAAPEAGKANRAVLALVAELCGVAARQVELVRGGQSRAKTVAVRAVDPDALLDRIARALPC